MKKNIAPVATTAPVAPVATTAPVAPVAKPCINASFDAMTWTADLYETVGKRSLDTLSARAKGYKTQGLLATLLLQPVQVVVDTLTDTIMGLEAGTTKQTVVIRSGVSANDPVPQKCKFVDGEWITTQETNLRQIHKQAIKSAYATLAKRDADGKDSYNLPSEWQGKTLEWQASPGSKDNGFFTVGKVAKKEEKKDVRVSIEQRSNLGKVFSATLAAVGHPVVARHLMMPIVEEMVATYRLAIPARMAAIALANDKRTAYAKAMAKAKIRDQYKAFLSAGLSEATVNLAMANEHGQDWKVTAAIG